jgi:hypothetical protein
LAKNSADFDIVSKRVFLTGFFMQSIGKKRGGAFDTRFQQGL